MPVLCWLCNRLKQLKPNTSYLEDIFFIFSVSIKSEDRTLNETSVASFHIKPNSQFITILKSTLSLQFESRPSANRESIGINRCPGIKPSGEYSEPNDDEDGLNKQMKARNNQEFLGTRFEVLTTAMN